MQTVITTIYRLLQEKKLVMELGVVKGPEMTFMFESHTVSIETPAAVSGWRIVPQKAEFQVLKFCQSIKMLHEGNSLGCILCVL